MKNSTNNEAQTSSQNFTFSRRRGRPKNNRPTIDTGTPETIMKRLLGITMEALDLCLERGIINNKKHWCGIHLRWLYTLRHGIPSVRANNLEYIGEHGQKSSEPEDILWRAAREQEYNNAIDALTKSGHATFLLNLCVYNERPDFLRSLPNNIKRENYHITESAARLTDGLNILSKLWNHN